MKKKILIILIFIAIIIISSGIYLNFKSDTKGNTKTKNGNIQEKEDTKKEFTSTDAMKLLYEMYPVENNTYYVLEKTTDDSYTFKLEGSKDITKFIVNRNTKQILIDSIVSNN